MMPADKKKLRGEGVKGWGLPPSPQPSPRGRGRFVCGGDELFDHYRHTLEELDKQKSMLGLIFNKSQNNFDSRRFEACYVY